jgi:hypothetical protein
MWVEDQQTVERCSELVPSDGGAFSKFEALRGAYEDLEWVHPDRGRG